MASFFQQNLSKLRQAGALNTLETKEKDKKQLRKTSGINQQESDGGGGDKCTHKGQRTIKIKQEVP